MKKLLLTTALILCTLLSLHAEIISGTTGRGQNRIEWSIDTETGILSITPDRGNNAEIPDYDTNGRNQAPWAEYSEYITTIIVGEGIRSIGENAFANLNNVTTIVFEGNENRNGTTTLPTLPNGRWDDSAFGESDMSGVTIVVPEDAIIVGGGPGNNNTIEDWLENLGGNASTDNVVEGEYSNGKCGDNLYWTLLSNNSEGTLSITGSGAMYNYSATNRAPWYNNRSDIQTVELSSEATTIGDYAFDGCTALTTVTLNSNAAIGTNAVPSTAATHLILKDKQQLLMNNNTFSSVSYVRNYNNTNWQALYLPYAISYDDWSENFDIARINNVHQYDDNDDGTPDRTTIEIFHLKSGSLTPNTPYFIRAKAAGETTITVADATLTPVDAQNQWCASATDIYTFVGTYQGISGSEMMQNNYYGMSAGSLIPVTNESNSLAAMRWYMKIEAKNSAAQASRPANIRVKEIGGTTDIQAIEPAETNNGTYYDLSGRPVENPTRGIYILNNKKIFVK